MSSVEEGRSVHILSFVKVLAMLSSSSSRSCAGLSTVHFRIDMILDDLERQFCCVPMSIPGHLLRQEDVPSKQMSDVQKRIHLLLDQLPSREVSEVVRTSDDAFLEHQPAFKEALSQQSSREPSISTPVALVSEERKSTSPDHIFNKHRAQFKKALSQQSSVEPQFSTPVPEQHKSTSPDDIFNKHKAAFRQTCEQWSHPKMENSETEGTELLTAVQNRLAPANGFPGDLLEANAEGPEAMSTTLSPMKLRLFHNNTNSPSKANRAPSLIIPV